MRIASSLHNAGELSADDDNSTWGTVAEGIAGGNEMSGTEGVQTTQTFGCDGAEPGQAVDTCNQLERVQDVAVCGATEHHQGAVEERGVVPTVGEVDRCGKRGDTAAEVLKVIGYGL